MKKKLVILLLLILQSCSPNPIYYNLSNETKEFLVYDINDTFQLKNSETNEIIPFTIVEKEYGYVEGGPNESSFIGATADIYEERGYYKFTDSSNCYTGELTLVAERENKFSLKVYLYGCFEHSDFTYEYLNNQFSSIEIDGNVYNNVYLFEKFQDSIFYSKEKGILKITETINFTETRRFTIVE
jgi:hypothetical protein